MVDVRAGTPGAKVRIAAATATAGDMEVELASPPPKKGHQSQT